MTYGSVCSGIEAASVAWHPLGWRPAWFAEIDAFPSVLLAHRWPGVPNLGDFTRIGDERGAIDVLVGGTPCQAFSVAGKRAGLDDPRGNLTLEFLGLAGRLLPRWLVWENVPGVLSIDEGRTFGAVLGLLGELGYGFAYRVLDAQFFGVPQRRRRVFLVGRLGDWRGAAAVLFERACLLGDSAPSREAGPSLARALRGSADRSGGNSGDEQSAIVTAPTLQAWSGRQQIEQPYVSTIVNAKWSKGTSGPAGDEAGNLTVAHSLRADGFDASEDGTGRGTPLVVCLYGDRTGPLDTDGHTQAICFDTTQVTSAANRSRPQPGGPSHPLAAGAHAPALAMGASATVRRLTPRECERLQGFPDDYTLVPFRGKPAADGPRYRALGNSMAVPVMRWIGERIDLVESIRADEEAA